MRANKHDGHKEVGHDLNFKPAKDTMEKVRPAYEHMQDYNAVKKNFRDSEGAVKTEPRNFLTTNVKQG